MKLTLKGFRAYLFIMKKLGYSTPTSRDLREVYNILKD